MSIGYFGFQQLYGNTYNVHLELTKGFIPYKKVIEGCMYACNMMTEAETIVAWIPVENTGACRGVIEAGFKRMGGTPELNFYVLEK